MEKGEGEGRKGEEEVGGITGNEKKALFSLTGV